MADKTPKLGIKLNLDGIKQVTSKLNEVKSEFNKTADTARKSFSKVGDEIKKTVEPAKEEIKKTSLAFRALSKSARIAFRSVQVSGKLAFTTLRSTGTATLRGLVATARTTGRGIGSALRAGTRGALAGLAGGLGAAGGLVAGASATAQEIQLQSRLAKTSGTTLEKFSALSTVVKNFGLESDDLSGALADLSEKLDEAAQGGAISEVFQRAGIAVLDASGNVRDAADVFLDIPDALRKFRTQTERSAVATKLIAGDAEKLSEVLALSNSELQKRLRLAKEVGATVTPIQVRAARQFLDAWNSLSNTFKGIIKDISVRLYPIFSAFFVDIRKFLLENKKLIVDFTVNGMAKLLDVVRDLFNALVGADTKVKNKWVLSLRDNLVGLGRLAGKFISVFSKIGPAIAESLDKGLSAVRDFSVSFLSAFSGNDTAFDIFGKTIEKGDNFNIAETISNGEIKKINRRRAKVGERILPFTVNENTAKTAQGFAGGLTAIIDFIKNKVVPAFGLIYDALRGDPNARSLLLDALDNQITNLLSRTPLLLDFYKYVFGDTQESKTAAQNLRERLNQLFNFDYYVTEIRNLWNALVDPNIQLAENHPLKLLEKSIDNVVSKTEAIREAFKGLTQPLNPEDPNSPSRGKALLDTGLVASSAAALALGGPLSVGIALGAIMAQLLLDTDGFIERLNNAKEVISQGLTLAWEEFSNKFPDFAQKIEDAIAPLRAFLEELKLFLGLEAGLTSSNKETNDLIRRANDGDLEAQADLDVLTGKRNGIVVDLEKTLNSLGLLNTFSSRNNIDSIPQYAPLPTVGGGFTVPSPANLSNETPVKFIVDINGNPVEAYTSNSGSDIIMQQLKLGKNNSIGGRR